MKSRRPVQQQVHSPSSAQGPNPQTPMTDPGGLENAQALVGNQAMLGLLREQGRGPAPAGGEEIAAPSRDQMDESSGEDLSDVTAYSGPQSAGTNAGIGAHTFALVDEIVFGKQNPSKETGAPKVTPGGQRGHHDSTSNSALFSHSQDFSEQETNSAAAPAASGQHVQASAAPAPGPPAGGGGSTSGSSGARPPRELVRMIEETTGASMQDVTLDRSPEARAEVAAMGGEAAAADGRVLLGAGFPGEDTALGKQILLHELAHLAGAGAGGGEQGARPSSRPRAGGATERGADGIVEAALTGRKAPSAAGSVGQREVGLWASGEHQAIGDTAMETAMDRYEGLDTNTIGETSGLTFGEGSELAGDFINNSTDFGDATRSGSIWQGTSVDEIICSLYSGAFDLLAPSIVENFNPYQRSWDTQAQRGQTDAAATFNATHNANHFYPTVHYEYASQHDDALALAGLAWGARQAGDEAKYGELRQQAITQESFASHFLQDSFAAGHQSPTADDSSGLSVGEADTGDLQRRKFHDRLNALENGLPMTGGMRFHGDDHMEGGERDTIADLNASSIGSVIQTADAGKTAISTSVISSALPAPDEGMIMSDGDAREVWRDITEAAPGEDEMALGAKFTAAGTSYSASDALDEVKQATDGAYAIDESVNAMFWWISGGGLATRGSFVRLLLKEMGVPEGSLASKELATAAAFGHGLLSDPSNPRMDDPIIRAEAAVMLCRAFPSIGQVQESAVENPFPDLGGFEWAAPSIYAMKEAAEDQGEALGYDDGLFGPMNHLQATDQDGFISKVV